MPLIDYFRKRVVVVEPVTATVGRCAAGSSSSTPENVPAGTSVLIIDDSKTMVAAPGKMSRHNHFNTLEALDGETVLKVLKKE